MFYMYKQKHCTVDAQDLCNTISVVVNNAQWGITLASLLEATLFMFLKL